MKYVTARQSLSFLKSLAVERKLSCSSNVLTTIERSLSTASELVSATWLKRSLTLATSKCALAVVPPEADAPPPIWMIPRSRPPPPPAETLLDVDTDDPELSFVEL